MRKNKRQYKQYLRRGKYRLYQRGNGYWYLQDNDSGDQTSLGTKDENTALELWEAANRAQRTPALNLEIAKVHVKAADPKLASRIWQEVMDELASHGKETSQSRCRRALESKAFDVIRYKAVVVTTAEDLKTVLKRGGSATNNYLRRLHNLALGNGWILGAIIPPKQWEKPPKTPKRGITEDEFKKIIAAEQNEQRKHYYELLWLIGAAQTDGAMLTNKNINWQSRVLSYQRCKTEEWCHLEIGPSLEALLKKLPTNGFLFPKIATLSDKHRAAEFSRRKRLLKLEGISLHSFRYGWAERAFAGGYSERHAQAALGHKSRAVHYGYAKGAIVVCPPLEPKNVIQLPAVTSQQMQKAG